MSDLDFLQQEKEAAASSGGFHVVGKVTFTPAMKVYIENLGNDLTTFPYKTAAEKVVATDSAKKLLAEHGMGDKRPDAVYVFIVPRETVLAGGANWKADQYYTRPMWQDKPNKDADGKVYDDAIVYNSVQPFIKTGRVKLGVPFWGSLKLMSSPFHVRKGEAGKARTRTSTDGTETKEFPTVFVLEEVFESAEAAGEFAAGLGAGAAEGVSDPSFPGGAWTYEAWLKVKPEIHAALVAAPVSARQAVADSLAKESYLCEAKHILHVFDELSGNIK